MKLNFKYFLILSVLLVAITGCRGKQVVSDAYAGQKFETTLVNISPSGMVTVKAWGNGSNENTAYQEALRNAVSTVVFDGFKTSKSTMATPLVTEVNARERYAEYFDRFFADGGEYRNFATEASTTDKSRIKAQNNGRQSLAVIFVVDRNSLRQQLKADGVIR